MWGAEASTKLEEKPRLEATPDCSGRRVVPAVRDVSEQYAVEVTRTVSRTLRLPPQSPQVEDVAQGVQLRLIEALRKGRISPGSDLLSYVRAIARNLALDSLRRGAREIACADLSEAPLVEGAGDFDEAAARLLDDYLSRAPEPLLAVYEARFVRRMTQKSAAGHLKISRQSLRTLEGRLKRGVRESLRQLLAPSGE